MRSCLVLPLHTELGELREKIVLLPGMSGSVFSVGEILSPCDRLVIDLTLDWFRPLMTPAAVLTLFAELYEYFLLPVEEKVVFRGYRLETNHEPLQKTWRIFEELLRVLREMFGVSEIAFPTIVSRRSLTTGKHPLLQCLAAMRSGAVERIPWSAKSEVWLAYEMDVLPWLGEFFSAAKASCGVVEGEKYTLGEVVDKIEVIFSSSTVTFDSHKWFRYQEEVRNIECSFSYGIENIAMDLLY